jgi:phage shock protein PspC (stress-responsive transcriptional regulator)
MKEFMIVLAVAVFIAAIVLVKYLIWSLAHPSAPVWTFFFTGR